MFWIEGRIVDCVEEFKMAARGFYGTGWVHPKADFEVIATRIRNKPFSRPFLRKIPSSEYFTCRFCNTTVTSEFGECPFCHIPHPYCSY